MRRNSKVAAIGGLIGLSLIAFGFFGGWWFKPPLVHAKQLGPDMVWVVERIEPNSATKGESK